MPITIPPQPWLRTGEITGASAPAPAYRRTMSPPPIPAESAMTNTTLTTLLHERPPFVAAGPEVMTVRPRTGCPTRGRASSSP
jgi:hypothetical protein